jgi:hypothetical protein
MKSKIIDRRKFEQKRSPTQAKKNVQRGFKVGRGVNNP